MHTQKVLCINILHESLNQWETLGRLFWFILGALVLLWLSLFYPFLNSSLLKFLKSLRWICIGAYGKRFFEILNSNLANSYFVCFHDEAVKCVICVIVTEISVSKELVVWLLINKQSCFDVEKERVSLRMHHQECTVGHKFPLPHELCVVLFICKDLVLFLSFLLLHQSDGLYKLELFVVGLYNKS
jgi:hypothetical protein